MTSRCFWIILMFCSYKMSQRHNMFCLLCKKIHIECRSQKQDSNWLIFSWPYMSVILHIFSISFTLRILPPRKHLFAIKRNQLLGTTNSSRTHCWKLITHVDGVWFVPTHQSYNRNSRTALSDYTPIVLRPTTTIKSQEIKGGQPIPFIGLLYIQVHC